MPVHEHTYASILTAAEPVVSRSLGRNVRLDDVTCLSEDDRRNLLLMVRDLSGDSPSSFIIKKVVADSAV